MCDVRGGLMWIVCMLACTSVAAQELPADIKAKLARRLSIDFAATPVGDVIQFLREVTHVNVVLDPRADAQTAITEHLDDVDVEHAMGVMLRPLGLRFGARCGVLVVARELRLKSFPAVPFPFPADADPAKPHWADLAKKRITIDFTDTRVADVCEYLSALGVPVKVDPAVVESAPNVTVNLKDIDVPSALTLIAFLSRTQLALDGDQLAIQPRPPLVWKDLRTQLVEWAEAPSADETDAINGHIAHLDSTDVARCEAATAALTAIGRRGVERLVAIYETEGGAPERRAAAKKLLEALSGLEIPDP